MDAVSPLSARNKVWHFLPGWITYESIEHTLATKDGVWYVLQALQILFS